MDRYQWREKEKERVRKNAGVEGKNVSKVKRKEAEVEEEVEVEVVATVVRGSRNRAGGGPALTDYGLASRRQPAWWGAPGVVVLFPSRLRHSFSFPRLPALPCYALPLALSSPTSFFTSFTLLCVLAFASTSAFTLPTVMRESRRPDENVENKNTEKEGGEKTLLSERWKSPTVTGGKVRRRT